MRGQPVPVRIRAVIEADLKASEIYLLLRGMEHAQVMDTDRKPGGGTKRELVRGKETSYETRIMVDGAQQLSKGEERVWDATITVPADGMPTLRGKMIRHVWEVQAGLDTVGNDPDSGWVEFDVV